MNLDDIQKSIQQMSDGELENLVSKIRETRGAKPIETVKKASQLEDAMSNMSAGELAQLVAKMEGGK